MEEFIEEDGLEDPGTDGWMIDCKIADNTVED